MFLLLKCWFILKVVPSTFSCTFLYTYETHFARYVRRFCARLVLVVSETTAVNHTQMLEDIISNTNWTSNTVCDSPQSPNCQQNLQMLCHNDETCPTYRCNFFFFSVVCITRKEQWLYKWLYCMTWILTILWPTWHTVPFPHMMSHPVNKEIYLNTRFTSCGMWHWVTRENGSWHFKES